MENSNREKRRPDINNGRIMRLYEQGSGVVAISRYFHCRHITISRRLKAMGIEPRRASMKGEHNPRWQGGRIEDRGYILIKARNHPNARKDGYIFEHRLVWEQTHSKRLSRDWAIHHINGIKSDNRPRNLLALPKRKHLSQALLFEAQKTVRELEIENKQLQQALERQQAIFYINEN